MSPNRELIIVLFPLNKQRRTKMSLEQWQNKAHNSDNVELKLTFEKKKYS